ncbi:MAG: CPBP family intramembrane metalloprotease [Bifidobacteriaceae bacterium]|nr:CPBP family intramembrane metalloprotease [Bifidobacteriaceae bacterium]
MIDQPPAARRLPGLKAEVLVVLGLSLGRSAIYALLTLIDRLTDTAPLAEQTAAMNTSDNAKPWLDLIYQLVGLGLALVPAALAIYLLALRPAAPDLTEPRGIGPWRSAAGGLGLDLTRPGRDLAYGVGLAGAIGLPGIAFYLAGRAMGLTVHISTANLGEHWWTVPVLILAAIENGLLEEVVAVGYLASRLRQCAWRTPAVLVACALLRGSYHMYQGIGPFLGNAVMGLIFTWFYLRTKRVMPLVVAHSVMDIVAFVGPSLLNPSWLT